MSAPVIPEQRAPKARAAAKRKRGPGWVPNQHGAWAMLVAPYVVGLVAVIADGRFELADVTLFGLWMVGYFAFFATSLWLKARRKPRYLPPVRAYVIASAALGLITLALQPAIATWAIVFAPVLGLGLFFAYRRDDRSLASGATTVSAACLMPAVVYAGGLFDFVRGLGSPSYDLIAAVCLACLGYFFGTVLYVKTMIRERGHVSYVVASVAWHVGCVLVTAIGSDWLLAAGVTPATWWALLVFFGLMAARSLIVPLAWPMRGKTLSPKHLGIGELFCTLALVAILIAAVL